MMSSLKVNFHKSKIYSIHVGDWMLEAALNFLSCDVDIFSVQVHWSQGWGESEEINYLERFIG